MIGSLVESCAPEAECGVGADITLTMTHKHEILYTVFAIIPFNNRISGDIAVVLSRVIVIACKDIEMRLRIFFQR